MGSFLREHEQHIRQYLVNLADQHSCKWAIDNIGNLVIYVPGTHGQAARPPVTLSRPTSIPASKFTNNWAMPINY